MPKKSKQPKTFKDPIESQNQPELFIPDIDPNIESSNYNPSENVVLENIENNSDDQEEIQNQPENSTSPNSEAQKSMVLNFSNSGNAIMFLTVIFLMLTGLINYKNFFNNYETIILNDFKDLLYWTRFTLANFLIVSFVLFIFGVDLNKALKEENKFVMLLTVILFVITLFAGQKIFLS
jgi:hypothetical protein